MAGTSIDVQVTGDLRRFEKNLQGLLDFDFTGLNRKIGQAVLNSTLQRFKDGVDPEGKPWPESGRARERAKAKRQAARRKVSPKTLVDTARLRNSIHVVATPDAAEVGTDVIYARPHQLGSPGQGLPVRAFLGLNDDDQRVLESIVKDHIEEKVGR